MDGDANNSLPEHYMNNTTLYIKGKSAWRNIKKSLKDHNNRNETHNPAELIQFVISVESAWDGLAERHGNAR